MQPEEGCPVTERQLLRWQSAAQAGYLSGMKKDHLLVAVPGAGKTFWAMHTARELLRAGRIHRIAIVAPTTHVKRQWSKTAHEVGLNIESDYRNSDGAWPADADGVSMTYSQMFEQHSLHRRNIARRPTLVILDEVHHLQSAASWGQAALEAFDMAAYRMHLSGTPWNKDGYIPWITYDENELAVADFSYSYQESLTDGVNCDVFFPKLGGRAEWEFDGKIHSHTFEEKLTGSDQARLLTTILDVAQSDFTDLAFQQADAELTTIRQMPSQSRAGGLIIAKDINHAYAIADALFGNRSCVVTSDDPYSGRRIQEFAKSTERWLISVRQVSEGVDIPRLRVLIYATNITERLFFRQAVGRVIRGPEPPAAVFLPADPRLLKHAAEIREERLEALRKHNPPQSGDGERQPSTFLPRSGETFPDGVIHAEGDVITQAELERAAAALRAEGSTPTMEWTTIVAKVLRRQAHATPSPSQAPPAADSPLQTERKEASRRIQNSLVNSYCYRTGASFAAINAQLNEAVGIRELRQATEDQLLKRYDLARAL